MKTGTGSLLARSPLLLLLLLPLLAVGGCNELRVFFPANDYETVPPDISTLEPDDPAVLVFTKTNGFRHEEAIPAGLAEIREVAERRGWQVFHTENAAVFDPEILPRFAATIWHNTSGDLLTPAQRTAFRHWLEAGGGFVGIHGAGGDFEYEWPWYVDRVIGAQFIGHPMGPQFQRGTVNVVAKDHPATRGLPDSWSSTEEWYSFDHNPRETGSKVLVTVDERSYSPHVSGFYALLDLGEDDLTMGEEHPVVWQHCVEHGRAIYSALGHSAEAYAMPEYEKLLEGAIAWAAGFEGAGCD
jgi:type 1 glutamine amidotransferase